MKTLCRLVGLTLAIAVLYAFCAGLGLAQTVSPEKQFLLDVQAALAKYQAATAAPSTPPLHLSPTPPLAAPTTPSAASLAPHPRFWPASSWPDVIAKAQTVEGLSLIAQATTTAKLSAASWDRCFSAALLFRLNNDATLGSQAAADLTTLATLAPTTAMQATIFPAVCYDWLAPILSPAQQAVILPALQKLLDTRDSTNVGLWVWNGYNNKAGGGMALAIATAGDLPVGNKDYVADFWSNNWTVSAPKVPLTWTWAVNQKQQGDAGNNEGFGYYYNNCAADWFNRGCFQQAFPASTFLQIGWFDRYPLWFLWQHEPNLKPASTVAPGWPWSLATKNYECGWTSTRDAFDMLRAATSGPNGPLARWLLNQTTGYTAGVNSVAQAILSGILIGDPRTKPSDPVTLGLPLHFEKQLGDVYLRSSWAPDAAVFYFGNNRSTMRSVSANGLSLFKRVPLLLYRGQVFAHTYEPGDFSNAVCFYSGSSPAVVPQAAKTNNAPGLASGTLMQNADGSWTGDALANLAPATSSFSVAQVTRSLRTVLASADLSTITVTDDVACDKVLTPHVVWNMPTQPIVSGRSITITGSDGTTTCTLAMDQDVPQIKVIGGPANFGDAFDGTPPANLSNDFVKLTPADQLHFAGHYRVHIPLPAGGGKITTTIMVK